MAGKQVHMLGNAYVMSLFISICNECGAVLNNSFGIVKCIECATHYMIKRIHEDSTPVFYKNEGDRKVLESYNEIRSYLPRLNSTLVEWEDTLDDSSKVPDFNPTICMVCKKPLESCMSVRLQKVIFVDYDDTEVQPVSGMSITTVKSRPSYRVGRAHKECALSESTKPFGMRIVDERPIPNKREKSPGTRENPSRLDHWKKVDPADQMEWE